VRQRHTLFEEFEYSGHWYLPEDPQRKVAGTVRFNNENGIWLRLLQSFRGTLSADVESLVRPWVILGVSDSGTQITLYQAARTGSFTSAAEEQPALFHANYMFLGHHFNPRSVICFSSLSVNFTYFEEWMGHATFKHQAGPHPPIYSAPEEVRVAPQSLEAEIRVHSTLRSEGDLLRSMETVHTGWLTINTGEYRNFAWYRKVLDSLQNFMTLLVGRPVYPRLVTAIVRTGEFDEWEPTREKTATVGVYFHQEFRTPTPPRRSHHQSAITEEVLIPLPNIASNLTSILYAWFEDAERLAPVYEAFFGALYNTKAYPQSQFLSLMQTAESFHRRTRPGKYVQEETYEEYRQEMVACIPNSVERDHRESLKTRLKYGNEYSLRKRLQELFAQYPARDLVRDLTEANPNFVNDIVGTRNYLAHLTDELKNKALFGPALLKANDDLRLILTGLLLRRLGIGGLTAYRAITERIERWEYLDWED